MEKYTTRGSWPRRDWTAEEAKYSDDVLALPPGRWVRKGNLKIFVPAPEPPVKTSTELIPRVYEWDEESLRRAHSYYVAKIDNPWVREGQRVYAQRAKQRQRERKRKTESEAA